MTKIDTDRAFHWVDGLLDAAEVARATAPGDTLNVFRGVYPPGLPESFGCTDAPFQNFPDAGLDCLDRRLNSSIAIRDVTGDGRHFAFLRARECGPGAARGRVRLFFPRMIQFDVLIVRADCVGIAGGQLFYGSRDGKNFTYIEAIAGGMHGYRMGGALTSEIHCAISAQLLHEYTWTVDFQEKHDGPSIRFPCGPDGVRQLLRDRDRPSGSRRRAYLKTWVGEHIRQRGTDESLVMQHLKGRQVIECGGFRCEVHAPLAEVKALLRKYGEKAPRSVKAEHQQLLDRGVPPPEIRG